MQCQTSLANDLHVCECHFGCGLTSILMRLQQPRDAAPRRTGRQQQAYLWFCIYGLAHNKWSVLKGTACKRRVSFLARVAVGALALWQVGDRLRRGGSLYIRSVACTVLLQTCVVQCSGVGLQLCRMHCWHCHLASTCLQASCAGCVWLRSRMSGWVTAAAGNIDSM